MCAILHGLDELVIIVLGSPFRGDDGVGKEIAQRLRNRMPGCHIRAGLEDSLALLNAWEGFPVAIVLDAAVSGSPPGTIHRIESGDGPLPKDLARCSSHGLGLAEAVELAKTLGRLPQRLIIYAIEAAGFQAGAGLSSEVTVSAQKVVEKLVQEIAHMQKT